MNKTSEDNIVNRVLLGRAIKNARSRQYNKGRKHPRWVAVMDLFDYGSTRAQKMCLDFGYDPDELVVR